MRQEAGPVEQLPASQEVVGDRNGWTQWVQYGLVRAGVALFAVLPGPLRHAVLTLLARVARALDRKHADPAREFLTTALGPELEPARRERLVLGAFRHLAMVAIDSHRRRRIRGPISERYRFEPCERMQELLDEPRPVVLVTGHIGDWEAATLGFASAGFRPLYVVAKPPRNRPLSIWMQRAREHQNVRLLSRYGAVEGARKVVQQGGSLGFLLDHRATKRAVLAPFFGREALCERTSGVLLRRLGLPVVITACYRAERDLHYRIVAPRVLEPEEPSRLSPEEIATEINRTLEQLILADRRAVMLAEAYFEASSERLQEVPARGEEVRLVELGTHCRGAIFLDGRSDLPDAAAEAIEELSSSFEGFHLGRYDLRIHDLEAFQRGSGFQVLELNGITAEPAHIYDPEVGVLEAYRTLFEQWRVAFQLGRANLEAGARRSTWREIWRGLRRHGSDPS